MFVASSPAVSNRRENEAMFSPYPFLSLAEACCRERVLANFSAHACASFAISLDHFSGGTLCFVRYLLCASRACFSNSFLVAELGTYEASRKGTKQIIFTDGYVFD